MSRATTLWWPSMRFTLCFAGWLAAVNGGASIRGDDLRINQIQVIGTHNSYHIAPTPATLQLIAASNRDAAPTLDYTHRPLEEQFGALGIRQVELDVFADPKGGRYAVPLAFSRLNPMNGAAGPDPNSDGVLLEPGFKILHVPDIDYRTSTPTWKDALHRIRKWSLGHRAHVPLFVLVELKDEEIEGLTLPLKFTPELLDELDVTIRECFEDDHLITPDHVRKSHATLREAVLEEGWPTLEKCRGRVLFALDNGGKVRDDYLAGHPSLAKRVLFVSGRTVDAPEAAFFKMNDPVHSHAEIKRLVQQGFLVRTRADADTKQSRENDTRCREQAFTSGAQLISTDYPEPDRRFSEYFVRFPGNRAVRSNPVSSAETAEVADVDLAE